MTLVFIVRSDFKNQKSVVIEEVILFTFLRKFL